MKVNLDNEIRKVKPTKTDTMIISSRIFNNYVNITFDEFAKAISENGQAFVAGHMEGGMTKDFWKDQYIFCLDMELDKITKQNIKMEDALKRCEKYNITPNIIYPTFSHTEEAPRYRIVWLLEETITDERVYNFIQRSLIRIFAGLGVDAGCVNCNRIFNGSMKGCFYKNENNRLTVPHLIDAVEMVLRKDKNAAKNTRSFAEKVGVNLVNGYLDAKVCHEKPMTEDKNIYYSNKNIKENYMINFTSMYSLDGDKMSIENNKIKNKVVRNFEFGDKDNNKGLYSKCRFYREVMNGDIWLEHSTLFYFLTNLLQVEGGTKKIKELVDVVIKETGKQEYHEKINYIEYTVKQAMKKNIYPTPCSHMGCPYYAECASESNMIDFTHTKKNAASKIKDSVPVRKREEVRKDLEDLFEKFFNEEERFLNTIDAWDKEISGKIKSQDIWFCKAPTGIGKTETFIKIAKKHINQNILYCAPTHQLLKDVKNRLVENGYVENIDFMVYPELPNFKEKQYIEKLYATGAYSAAVQELKNIAETNEQVKEYLEEKNKVEKFNKMILTTHTRAIVSPMKCKPKYVIFDEDIILSTLASFKTIKIEDLYYVATELTRTEIKDKNMLLDLYNTVKQAADGRIIDTPQNILFNRNELSKCISKIIKNNKEYSSNVLDFYNSFCFTKIDNVIYYVVKRDFGMLPAESKILCLSATLDREISKKMFPESIFVNLGYVENKGELYQIPSKSLSKGCFWRNKKGCEKYVERLCNKYLKDYNIITFPEFMNEEKSDLEKKINLRNCSGIDSLQDKDLAVVGTPHVPPVIYYLFAKMLGYNINICRGDEREYKYAPVNKNGFTFYFNTYFQCSYLQNIQFYLIDSTLMQCVGRARLINNPERKVLVLSNYLLPQAKIFNYSQEEVDLLMTTE